MPLYVVRMIIPLETVFMIHWCEYFFLSSSVARGVLHTDALSISTSTEQQSKTKYNQIKKIYDKKIYTPQRRWANVHVYIRFDIKARAV